MGVTVLDAGVVIGWLDATDAFHQPGGAALDAAVRRRDRLVLPASAYAEVLVGALVKGAAETAEGALAGAAMEVHDIDQDTAVRAAELRAVHKAKLKLPDALVVATAIQAEADHLVTTDHGWPIDAIDFAGTIHVL
jgi:predicted nucleic acid-binding protein